jgi:hypothetical protein
MVTIDRRLALAVSAGLLVGYLTGWAVHRQRPEVPAVPTGPYVVAIVHETLETGVPLYAHQVRGTLERQGHTVYVIDDDVVTGEGRTPAHLAPLVEQARSVGLPALIVTTADGGVVHAGPLPETADALLEVIP